MLYDPKWEKTAETKPDDPYKLETLIAWIEKYPPDRRYDYSDAPGCLLGQYMKSHGLPILGSLLCEPVGYFRGEGAYIAGGWGGNNAEWTFGAALKRAYEVAATKAT